MKNMQNTFFLFGGLVLLLLGWQSVATASDQYGNGNAKWWAFGLTLFGGLILGKWISDYKTPKK